MIDRPACHAALKPPCSEDPPVDAVVLPPGSGRLVKIGASGAAVSWLGVILFLCLTPASSAPQEGLCLICGEQGSAGLILNVGLYLPLGLALALGAGARVAVAACLLLSAGVEAAQLVVPGRHSAPADLLANTVGGILGATMGAHPWAWLFPRGSWARFAAAAAVMAAAAVIVATGLLLVPTVPGGRTLFAQVTPVLGGHDPYRGRLLAAHICGTPLAAGVIDRVQVTDALLGDSAVVGITVTLGPPTARLAPVLRLVDDGGLEAFQAGVDGTDLVIRYRYRADDLRFARPELRVEDWAAGVGVGDTVRLLIQRNGAGATLVSVPGQGLATLGHTVGRGWSFLRALPEPLRDGAGVVDWVWLAGLLAPFGWWAGSLGWLAGGGGGLLTILLSVPMWTPAITTPIGELAAAAVGMGIGRALRLWADGRF